MSTFTYQPFLNDRFYIKWLDENLAKVGCRVLKLNHWVIYPDEDNFDKKLCIYRLRITTDDKGRPNFTVRQLEALLTLMQAYEEKLKEVGFLRKTKDSATFLPTPYIKTGDKLGSTRTLNKGNNMYEVEYQWEGELS